MTAINGKKKRVLSGIQPSGSLHIGNYIGAISLWVEQQEAYDNLFCVADLHALTTPESTRPECLREWTRETAALYLACGIDPEKCVVFLQSDVPEHTYLAWILMCCTPTGWLERMTQFKSKASSAETVGTGLLAYPVLQAADILVYRADFVPVGDDQKQHVELARDIAQRFNRIYGDDYFRAPEPLTRTTGARIMGLDDPFVKMSKSLANSRKGHAIRLLDSPKDVRSAVMSAVTDSANEVRFEHASPGVRNLLVLYQVLSGEPMQQIETRLSGKGYGYLKRELADLIVETLRPIQEKHHAITEATCYLDRILAEGAERARAIAGDTIREVRALTGL